MRQTMFFHVSIDKLSDQSLINTAWPWINIVVAGGIFWHCSHRPRFVHTHSSLRLK